MQLHRDNILPVLQAIIVHVAIVLPLVVGIGFSSHPVSPMMNAIPATLIDSEIIDRPKREKAAAERRRQQALEQQQREAEARRAAEQQAAQRALEEKRRQEAERKHQAEIDARRKADAAARLKAEEAARQKAAEEKRQAEAAAKQKAAEEKRKAEDAARRKQAEEEARKKREAELQRSLALEENYDAAVNSGEHDRYLAQVKAKIMRFWTEPMNLGANYYCELTLRQIPGGQVVSVNTGRCDDELLQRSAENAIRAASPLPLPDDPVLFQREMTIIFAPEENQE